MSAYNETCAAIGNDYWNHRMFLLHADARYLDVMERTLYNGLLSGVSLDGRSFFYPNPLESSGQHQRSPWFGCACCPGNITRFVASVPGYVYAHQADRLYVNLFVASTATVEMDGGPTVTLTQQTRYPWDGHVRITVSPDTPGTFALHVRVPGWARGEPVPSDLYRFADAPPVQAPALWVNGEPVPLRLEEGYAMLERTWREGDRVELELPMPARRVAALDSVEADRGRVALQRGPVVYCVEWPETGDGHVRNLFLPDSEELQAVFEPGLLGGVTVLKGTAQAWRLMPGPEGDTMTMTLVPLTAIPYYAWAHRGRGEMAVWLAREIAAVRPIGYPTLASRSGVSASFGPNPGAVNDLLEPRNSNDHDVPYYHWWSHKGTTEWIQYDFPRPSEVSTVEVYWFDDTGQGECRVPASWRLLYFDEGDWRPVWTEQSWGTARDTWNRVTFETVRTRSVRLEVVSQEGWAGGIHEWRIR